MISRQLKIRTIRTLEEDSCAPSSSARITVEGLDGFMPLTADDLAWVRRVRAAGGSFVFTITEESALPGSQGAS